MSPSTNLKVLISSCWWFPKLKLTFKCVANQIWTDSVWYILRFRILNTTTPPKNDAERAVNRQPGYRAGNSYRRYFINTIIQTIFPVCQNIEIFKIWSFKLHCSVLKIDIERNWHLKIASGIFWFACLLGNNLESN